MSESACMFEALSDLRFAPLVFGVTRFVERRSTQRFSIVHWEGFGRDYPYLASTIMLTLETQHATTPKSYIARYNAGLLQNCKDQMPVDLLGSNLQCFQRAKDVLEACQR